MARIVDFWQFPLNVGPVDQGIRIVLGLSLLALTAVGPQSWWGFVGVIPLFTGVAGYCPLYSMLDVSTVGTPHRMHPHGR